jgi:DNA-binding response OmpR family regulator
MGGDINWRTLSIIVADDDPTFNALIVKTLHQRGVADIRICLDGAVAFRMVFERAPDVLILGLGLPRDGLLTLDRIKASRNEAVRSVPVVMVTAFATKQRLDLLRGAGAADLLPKPPNADQIARAICTALRPADALLPRSNTSGGKG